MLDDRVLYLSQEEDHLQKVLVFLSVLKNLQETLDKARPNLTYLSHPLASLFPFPDFLLWVSVDLDPIPMIDELGMGCGLEVGR